jgi:ABC-type multidrug transport system fused ATPase/permease subunit
MGVVSGDSETMWSEGPGQPQLRDVNLSIPRGSLVFVIGRVGSGKSSLISGLLNEIPITAGHVTVRGSTSYCAQQAWIQNASVRSNILFGLAFEAVRYRHACDAADLASDFESFPDGDRTEIGERGINLSGGQRQRVAFARAVYSDADVVLLDDVLSAVDVHVGERLMRRGIMGALKGKTRILVTHAVHWIDKADVVVVMEGGRATGVGSVAELTASGFNFAKHIEQTASPRASEARESAVEDKPEKPKKEKSKKVTKLIKEEESKKGVVKLEVWKGLFKYLGSGWSSGIILCILVSQLADLSVGWWTGLWSNADDLGWQHTQGFYLLIFSGLSLASVICSSVRTVMSVVANEALSLNIHSQALLAVFRSPVSYFDSTRTGRILNRFSSDLSQIDGQMVNTTLAFIIASVGLLLSVVSVVLMAPHVLVFFLLAVPFIRYMQHAFRANAREMQRLGSLTRSPIFSAFTEMLGGVATVRGYHREQHFREQNEVRLMLNLSAYYNGNAASQWLSTRLNLLGNLLITVVIAMTMLQHIYGWNLSLITFGSATLTPGLIGLSLAKSLDVKNALTNIISTFTTAETSLISLERLLSFIALPPEPALTLAGDDKLAQWPSKGEVSFNRVWMRYRPDLPMVLKDVSFVVPAGASLGVVGRTGAGKSSILQALFRMVDVDQGMVAVDGVDLSTVGLTTLRSALSIIPQDPVLFSGTLRSNLDPMYNVADDEMWDMLREVQLDAFARERGGLDMTVAANGENLAVGERQLVCLARALLLKSKVVVLDEATANVDNETDARIQQTLRAKVKATGSTCIVIAHRIATVADCSYVLVLEDGQVAEYGPTADLLRNPESRFAKMAAASNIAVPAR